MKTVKIETGEDDEERLHRIIHDTRAGTLPPSTSDWRWLLMMASAGIVLSRPEGPSSVEEAGEDFYARRERLAEALYVTEGTDHLEKPWSTLRGSGKASYRVHAGRVLKAMDRLCTEPTR